MKRKLFLTVLILSLLLLTGCYTSIESQIPQLTGYWKQMNPLSIDAAGFIHIRQDGDTITQRAILNGTDITERTLKITDNGFEETRERHFPNTQILSGEIIPAGTYTTITESIADITDNEFKIYQQFNYILVDGEKKLLNKNDWYLRVIRAFAPKAIDKYLEDYDPRLEVTRDYEDIFTAGETYDITIETIPDDNLPNYTSEGTVTLSTGQKEIVLPLELANWYGYFSQTNNFRYKFFQLQAANEAIEIKARCDNDEDTPDIIEGDAKINGEVIGTILF